MPNPILYPIPEGIPAPNPTNLKAKLGGGNYLLAVGRLAKEKGFDRLLAAFARVHARHPDWRLVILGEGPLRAELEQKSDELGLSEAVALPGTVGNIGDWYEACDAYVMTSLFEGFGNTLAEALVYGLPAVAVDCETGPREILRHEVDGLLVPQDNQDALVDALDLMIGSKELRARFAVGLIAGHWEGLFRSVA
jgi:glycosyltransferase involved in cell wall biosynthesis